jgi:hypothetical protein
MFSRLASSLVLVVLASPPTPAMQLASSSDNDRAKQLFLRMEERLAKARTLKCLYEIQVESREATDSPAGILLLKCTLFLAESNKVRDEMIERSDGYPEFKLVISDGTRYLWHEKNSPARLFEKPWTSLRQDSLTSLARSGFYVPTMPLPPVATSGSKDRFPLSDFRLGSREIVGGREAQRLDYQLSIKGQAGPTGEKASFPVTIWLDPETSLPIKRVVSLGFAGITSSVITESYRKLVLDGEVNGSQFELPKGMKIER